MRFLYFAFMKNLPVHKNKSLENIKDEEWREIPFTEGYYLVSNLGRVKALERIVYSDTAPLGRRIKEKILSQLVGKNKNNHTGDQTFELSVTYTPLEQGYPNCFPPWSVSFHRPDNQMGS